MLLLKENHIEFFAKKVDEWYKSDNVIIEAMDGKAVELILKLVNNKVSPYIPEDVIDDVQAGLDGVIEENWEQAALEALDIIEEVLDDLDMTPGLKNVISGVLTFLDGVLQEIL